MISNSLRTAGWLPGVDAEDIDGHVTLSFSTLDVRVPRLTPTGLTRQMERITQARDAYLSQLSVQRLIELLDRVANRWLDPASPYLAEAVAMLPLVTGYDESAIRKGLTGYLGNLRAENVRRLVEQELPDPAVLDSFRPHGPGGGETRAFGPRLTTHIWSGNVPGLPLQSLLSALLVKSACLGKVASEEPLFATLLAESIAEVDARLAACVAVVYWPGGDDVLEPLACSAADAVIAYGGVQAIDGIRRRVPPGTRFVPYGHKLSFAAVGRTALSGDQLAETVDRAAYDVSKYDQQGCLSPHLIYVETGGQTGPREFAAALAAALAGYAALVPRGRLSLDEAASSAAARQHHEARELAGAPVALFAGEGWAVLFDEDPAFQASCLNRTVWVKPVRDLLAELPDLVSPVRDFLQTCGLAAEPAHRKVIAEQLGRLGVDRVCPLGRMGDVGATWHHDGRCNLLELLRWTDLEPDGASGRWEFGHPALGLYGKETAE